MADVEMTEEKSQKQPVPSIETKENEKTVKSTSAEEPGEEAGAAAEGSDNDAPGDNDDEGIEVTDTTDGRGTGDLYKNFKAITELLLNFKITIRGNEYVRTVVNMTSANAPQGTLSVRHLQKTPQ